MGYDYDIEIDKLKCRIRELEAERDRYKAALEEIKSLDESRGWIDGAIKAAHNIANGALKNGSSKT